MIKNLRLFATLLLLAVFSGVWAQHSETFDFVHWNFSDADSWSTKYEQHNVEGTGATVVFDSANKQGKGMDITDCPVTKGANITVTAKDNNISAFKIVLRQWTNKKQTVNLETSTDGTTFKVTGNTSDEFSLSADNVDAKAIRFTFSSKKNQVGIESITLTYKDAGTTQESVTVRLSEAGYATLYYGDRALTIPVGVVAKTYKIADNTLAESKEYKEGDVLPKATAVLLQANPGEYTFAVTDEEGTADEANVLKGSDEKVITTGGEVYYAFSNGSKGYGFYWMKENGAAFENGAHKAYVAYTPATTAQGAKSFLGLGEGTTGIQSAATAVEQGTDAVYNLAGQRVGKDYKGIVIVNGKKHLNK
ncbi:MAG: hypothetical protein K6A82_07040 [Prevotella sp.]|nr:hypothetical protein [Prevotella sp.]